jgi:hypothetical protein
MQIVSDAFHEMAQNEIVPIDWDFRVSFDKSFDPNVTFFILDVSLLDGPDLLAPSEDNPIMEWDKYSYKSYKDRVIDLDWEREIDFPYSVQSAIADITVNNFDGYFSPESGSPISSTVLPKRPIRLYAGFQTVGVVQEFVGLTQGMPELDDPGKTATFSAMDFLSEMYNMSLTETIAMQNVRTDEVLSELFQQFGLNPSQYSLGYARNVIPFLFWERGKSAGEAFRQLMQAEMGKLWLDEQGIIRFEDRLYGVQTPVMTFNDNNIISIRNTGDDEIINTVRITSNIRKVQSFQPIFTNARPEEEEIPIDSNSFIVPASSTAFYPDASLNDPSLTATTPTVGRKTDTSWFTAVNANTGDPVTTNINITLSELRTNSYVMLFNNTNAFPVAITQVEVWGEPAKIVDSIRYEAYDEDSVEKYGQKILDIDNDFFGDYSNCDSFAEFVLDGYKEFASVIEIEAKGDPALQLGDVITVQTGFYNDDYKITKIITGMRPNEMSQTITARKYTVRNWFILDQSLLNGPDLLAP